MTEKVVSNERLITSIPLLKGDYSTGKVFLQCFSTWCNDFRNMEHGRTMDEVVEKYARHCFVKPENPIRVIHYKEPNNLRDQCVIFAGTLGEALQSKENCEK